MMTGQMRCFPLQSFLAHGGMAPLEVGRASAPLPAGRVGDRRRFVCSLVFGRRTPTLFGLIVLDTLIHSDISCNVFSCLLVSQLF